MSNISAYRFLTDQPNEHPDGYTPTEIATNWVDDDLETIHNYIQWVFPLCEPSNYNHGAPILTVREINKIRKCPIAQQNLRMLMWRMIDFYDRTARWLTDYDHNHLRITRIIKSLGLLTEPKYALMFYHFIMWKVMAHSKLYPVNPTTVDIWRKTADAIQYPGSKTARETMDELNRVQLAIEEQRHGEDLLDRERTHDGNALTHGGQGVDPHAHQTVENVVYMQAVAQEGGI